VKPLIYFTGVIGPDKPISQFTKLLSNLRRDEVADEKRLNEAPRSKLRGIKAELRRSQPRLRSYELRRGSPCLSSLQQAAGYSGEGE